MENNIEEAKIFGTIVRKKMSKKMNQQYGTLSRNLLYSLKTGNKGKFIFDLRVYLKQLNINDPEFFLTEDPVEFKNCGYGFMIGLSNNNQTKSN